jgi:hypothetical protein
MRVQEDEMRAMTAGGLAVILWAGGCRPAALEGEWELTALELRLAGDGWDLSSEEGTLEIDEDLDVEGEISYELDGSEETVQLEGSARREDAGSFLLELEARFVGEEESTEGELVCEVEEEMACEGEWDLGEGGTLEVGVDFERQ